MKAQTPGISLAVSLITSLLILGLALALVTSIDRSLGQSFSLEQNTQLFYAAESGLEAGIFQHNARGQGTHFITPQPLTQDNNLTTSWTLSGRDSTYEGEMRSEQKISIPFFYDESTAENQTPSENFINDTFSLHFRPPSSTVNWTLFDFGDVDDGPLIDWSVSRVRNGELEVFLATANDPNDLCASPTSYICRDEVRNAFASNSGITLSSVANGEILPCANPNPSGICPETLQNFMLNGEKHVLTFQPIRPFSYTDTGGNVNTIASIPYEITLGTPSTEIPLPEYTITSEVQRGAFAKTLSITVPESAQIGAFDFVVVD